MTAIGNIKIQVTYSITNLFLLDIANDSDVYIRYI